MLGQPPPPPAAGSGGSSKSISSAGSGSRRSEDESLGSLPGDSSTYKKDLSMKKLIYLNTWLLCLGSRAYEVVIYYNGK